MSYFVIIDGLLYSCGNNYYGQLGLNDRNDREELTQITNPNCKFASVSNFFVYTMAIDENGYLWSCGENGCGQLGLNDYNSRWELTQVSITQTFQVVSCGYYHTAAIDTEGFLWVCGANNFGQLGLSHNEQKNTLTRVSDNKFIAVSCAATHTIVLDENRFLWACGANHDGQLGLVSCEQVKVLTKVCDQQFMAVSSSWQHTVAIDIHGYLWSCGDNMYGQSCCYSKKRNVSVLSKVPNLEKNFIAVCCHYQSTLLIDNKNHLWCCGRNNTGHLGFGHVNKVSLCKNNLFTQSVIYASVNYGHAFVITKGGTLWVSGRGYAVGFGGFGSDLHIFSKIPLAEPVDIVMNCSPRKMGSRTKGAHY